MDGLPVWLSRCRRRARPAAPGEVLDDHHGAATTRAWWPRVGGLLSYRGVVRRRRDFEQPASQSEAVLAGGAGEQAVVPDTVEAAWQNVDQEAADELVGDQSHDALPFGAGAAIVLVAEGHLIAVEGDEAAVRDRHAMGVAREIGEHRLGPSKGRLGINHPALSADRSKVADEGTPVAEPCHLSEESELSGTMEVEQPGDEQPPEQRAEHPDRQQKGWSR